MILIIGTPVDLRVKRVLRELQSRDVDHVLFNTSDYPYQAGLTQTIDSSQNGELRIGERRVPVADIQSVYYCVQTGFKLPQGTPPEYQNAIYQNIHSAAWSFLHTLECPFINPIQAADFHRYKAAALQRLHSHGFKVPETLVTNEPEPVIAFYRRLGDRAVYKSPWGQSHTKPLTQADLEPARLAKLAHAPVLFQEYITGSEIRVYVIGASVFALKVESRMVDINLDDQAPRVPVELPEAVAAMCCQIAEVMGLPFTAIDLRVTVDGQYYVLEANSSPDFVEDEQITGYPMGKALVDLLLIS